MKCIEIRQNKLALSEAKPPKAKKGEVLIKVHMAGVNRADVLQKRGLYPPPEGITEIPGLEVSGEIVEIGRGVTFNRGKLPRLKKGMMVTALVAGGAYAEYCVVPANQCLPIPKGMDMLSAAGILETFATAWSNIFDIAKMKKGETLLLHGGSSGVGTAAIQLAKTFGIKIFVTTGSDEKCKRCKKLGADLTINYNTQDFAAEIIKATKNKGVNVVIDMIGGDYVERNLEVLALKGRYVIIGTQHGHDVEIDLIEVMNKNITITGATLRDKTIQEKTEIITELYKQIWPLMAKKNAFLKLFCKKRISPIIDKEFPLEQAQIAYDYLDSGDHFGKVILRVVE